MMYILWFKYSYVGMKIRIMVSKITKQNNFKLTVGKKMIKVVFLFMHNAHHKVGK